MDAICIKCKYCLYKDSYLYNKFNKYLFVEHLYLNKEQLVINIPGNNIITIPILIKRRSYDEFLWSIEHYCLSHKEKIINYVTGEISYEIYNNNFCLKKNKDGKCPDYQEV